MIFIYFFHENITKETDIYYKQTNPNDYLPYDDKDILKPTKNNIPYNLAKTIEVFVSNPEDTIRIRLEEVKPLLIDFQLVSSRICHQ